MIRLIPKIFKMVKPKIQFQTINQPIIMSYKFSSFQNNRNQKQIYYEDILVEHDYNKKFQEIEKMNESEQIYFMDTIVKKYGADANQITDYGNIIIDNFLSKQDYRNALKCCEIITSFFKNKVSNQTISLFPFYSSMCECSIKLDNRNKALSYLKDAEDIFNTNIDELKKDNHDYFNHIELLALRCSDLGLQEKCVYYSALCLSIDDIQTQKKVITTLMLIDSLENQQKMEEAIQFGIQLLNQVSFEEIGVVYNDMQLELVKVIYERVASLLLVENQLQKAYLFQDELLYLIQITENEENYKYEAVYNWRQENLYQLALKEKGEIYDTLLQSEIQKQKKLGVFSDEIKKQAEEKANKHYLFIKSQTQIVEETINIHKEVYQISEMRFEVENQLNEELQQKLLSYVKKSVELEEKLLSVPIIDQYFVKNEYYKIKPKLSKDIQDKIEKQFQKKK